MSLKNIALIAGVCLVGLPTIASAHPSKFPHRHVEELEKPKKQPVKRKQTREKRSNMTFSFGPTLNYTTSEPGDLPQELLELGGGIDLAFNVRIDPYVGFRMNGMLSLHDGREQASHKGAFLSGVTGDALIYILPQAQRIEPYAIVGIGGFGLDGANFLLPLQGFGAQGGLGIRVRLNPVTSLALEGLSRIAYMDNSKDRLPDEPFESAVLFLQSANLKLVLDL